MSDYGGSNTPAEIKDLISKIIKENFYYDNGFIRFLKDARPYGDRKRKKNDIYLSKKNNSGYMHVRAGGVAVSYHVACWILCNGCYPDGMIDHIDGNKENNKIENLRIASKNQNAFNQKLSKNNKSGFKCVFWSKQKKKWLVSIRINGSRVSFGFFNDLEFAGLVASSAREKYHGQFARDK